MRKAEPCRRSLTHATATATATLTTMDAVQHVFALAFVMAPQDCRSLPFLLVHCSPSS